VQSARASAQFARCHSTGHVKLTKSELPDRCCYNARMTLMTVTYELQEPLKAAQFKALGDFANTYGLHSFRLDEKTGYLHLDYDASRLKEIVVEHVLRGARIPVLRKLEARNN
jgi:hypothetical protein